MEVDIIGSIIVVITLLIMIIILFFNFGFSSYLLSNEINQSSESNQLDNLLENFDDLYCANTLN